MFQSRNVLKQVNHHGSYLLQPYDRQGNDGKEKTRYEVQALVAEYETDGSMKFITGEDLELGIVTNKRTVRPYKLELDEAT